MKQKSINERIAVEVMGWKLRKLKTLRGANPFWHEGNITIGTSLPDWCGDLTLAMGLLEGAIFTIQSEPLDNKFQCFFYGYPNYGLRGGGCSHSNSLPESICLAVLDWHKKNPRSPEKTKNRKKV